MKFWGDQPLLVIIGRVQSCFKITPPAWRENRREDPAQLCGVSFARHIVTRKGWGGKENSPKFYLLTVCLIKKCFIHKVNIFLYFLNNHYIIFPKIV